jgi:thioredoxin-like negative regulator of GroEL
MAIPVVNEKDFEREVIRSPIPVLVEFFQRNSAACQRLEPELEAFALEVEGKAKIVKVDTDASPRLADMLRVQNLPTFYVFVDGRPAHAQAGATKREDLRRMMDAFLPRAEGAIKARELAPLLKEKQVVAIDTREERAFGRAHIPGAIHMPLAEIEGRLAELHMLGAEPVLYCRAGHESKELADKLTAQGVPVGFLEGGFLAWEAELFPVERPD